MPRVGAGSGRRTGPAAGGPPRSAVVFVAVWLVAPMRRRLGEMGAARGTVAQRHGR
ncbi:hypothetical protein [Nocardia cyriacigeorgica]|uniref:hypothetical protein n=1 Tax=Nocardia cyriacigeorgica TaxID=135487 RepID=UPI0024557711|nr:hypothetical protein [Nocardia cyriacigeorgica]